MKKASASLSEIYWPLLTGPTERKAVARKEVEWSSSFILLLLLISIVSYPFFVPYLLTYVEGVLR